MKKAINLKLIGGEIFGNKDKNLVSGYIKWLYTLNKIHEWDHYSLSIYYNRNSNLIYTNQNKFKLSDSWFIIVEIPKEIKYNTKETIQDLNKYLIKYEKLKGFL